MRCRRIQRKLSPYLDCELSPRATEAVRRHVETCAACRRALEETSALSGLLDAMEEMTPRPFFVRRVMAAAEAPVPAQPVVTRLKPALSRIAAVLVTAVGLWLGATLGGSLRAEQAVDDAFADELALDLEVAALSATPPGSLAEVYLDLVAESE